MPMPASRGFAADSWLSIFAIVLHYAAVRCMASTHIPAITMPLIDIIDATFH